MRAHLSECLKRKSTVRALLGRSALRRWWYVVDWPSAEAKAMPVKDPECWEKMDGMPGAQGLSWLSVAK